MILAGSLRAQSSPEPRFYVGTVGGYNLTAYSTDLFSIPGTSPGFNVVANATGHGFFTGITSEIAIDTDMQNFIVIEAAYDSKPGDFSWIANRSFAPGHDTAYYLSASLGYLQVDLGYKFNFWNGSMPNYLGFQVSASLGFATERSFERTKSVYLGNATTPISSTQEFISIANAEQFRLAIRTELTYDIPLFSNWLLTPSIGYDAPLTKVDPSLNWRASALYFAMALQLGL